MFTMAGPLISPLWIGPDRSWSSLTHPPSMDRRKLPMTKYLPTASRFSLSIILLSAVSIFCGCAETTSSDGDAPANSALAAANIPLPSDDELREMVDEVLDFTEGRFLEADRHAAWQIMHGILAYGHSLHIRANGELVPALKWILEGGNLRGWDLREGEHGLDVLLGPGDGSGQGHEDQWLAVLSQCGLQPDSPIRYRGKDYTVRDLIIQSQWDLYEGMEASWTVIGLTAYLPLDAKWTSKDGNEWTIERIMAMEAAQDLDESACGGSHRLIGMTMALERYLHEGHEPSGGWAAAQTRIDENIAKAKNFQHRSSGAFSSSYFERSSHTPDVAKQIGTTGHTLEFLALALETSDRVSSESSHGAADDEKVVYLDDPWVTRAVVHLCKLLRSTRDMEVECGALYHAAHGLQIYRLKRFGQREFPSSPSDTAESEPTTTAEAPGTVR